MQTLTGQLQHKMTARFHWGMHTTLRPHEVGKISADFNTVMM